MLTLWTLFEACLLCLNAVCVLHEQRFLMKLKWSTQNFRREYDEPSPATRALDLIRSIRMVMKIPLIFVNIMVIIIKLLFG